MGPSGQSPLHRLSYSCATYRPFENLSSGYVDQENCGAFWEQLCGFNSEIVERGALRANMSIKCFSTWVRKGVGRTPYKAGSRMAEFSWKADNGAGDLVSRSGSDNAGASAEISDEKGIMKLYSNEQTK